MSPDALPRRLLLLRHAKSSWEDHGTTDHDRPLAPRGQAAAPKISAFIAEHDLEPEWVMVSTAARTLETWQLVRPCCLGQPVEIIDPSLYLASARQLLSRIRETPSRVSSVLAIGHNPGMHELALRLAESGVGNDAASLTEKFPTGALAVFSFKERPWADISAARLTLEHFVQPRELTQTV